MHVEREVLGGQNLSTCRGIQGDKARHSSTNWRKTHTYRPRGVYVAAERRDPAQSAQACNEKARAAEGLEDFARLRHRTSKPMNI